MLAVAILSVTLLPASANEENFVVLPQHNSADGRMTALLQITLEYPPGSTLSKEFGSANEQYFYVKNITDPESPLLKSINVALLSSSSSAIVSSANVTFRGRIQGDIHSVTLTSDIELRPVLQQIVSSRDPLHNGTTIDLNWRSFVLREPLTINTTDSGSMDINHPLGLLNARHPDVADKISKTNATEIFSQPVLSFDSFGRKLVSWHFLFDPTFSIEGSQKYRNATDAKLVSVYSIGQGVCENCSEAAVERQSTALIDGYRVSVHSYVPPPSGQLMILGYAQPVQSDGSEKVSVSSDTPPTGVPASGIDQVFPQPIPVIVGVLAVGVTGAVVLLSRKRARA